MGHPEDLVILTVSGSLRSDSTNRALLRAAAEHLPPGVRAEEYSGIAGLPAFDEDLEVAEPGAVRAFRSELDRADALLVATPEYNGSIPGALKNALDWASRPYGSSVIMGLPSAVVGASPSQFGATRAQAALRAVLDASGAVVVQSGATVTEAPTRFDPDGRLVDAEARAALAVVVNELVRSMRGSDVAGWAAARTSRSWTSSAEVRGSAGDPSRS